MKFLPIIAAAACLVASAPALATTLVNADFETGALAPWVPVGSVAVVTSTQTAGGLDTITAPQGQYFAELIAGEDPDVFTTLSQTFMISEASTLSFLAAFVGYDEESYPDEGYVRVLGPGFGPNAYVVNWSTATVGSYTFTGWENFSVGLASAGVYTLEAGVRNVGSVGDPPDLSSRVLLDDVRLAVPEPATWAMMIGGFGLVGVAMRRRRAIVVA